MTPIEKDFERHAMEQTFSERMIAASIKREMVSVKLMDLAKSLKIPYQTIADELQKRLKAGQTLADRVDVASVMQSILEDISKGDFPPNPNMLEVPCAETAQMVLIHLLGKIRSRQRELLKILGGFTAANTLLDADEIRCRFTELDSFADEVRSVVFKEKTPKP